MTDASGSRFERAKRWYLSCLRAASSLFHFYTGRLPPEQVADVMAKARGHWGSCAEYLHTTVAHLEHHGIRDRNLSRLQALVAARIKPRAPDLAGCTASQVP